MLGNSYRKQRCHPGMQRDPQARNTEIPLTCIGTLAKALGLCAVTWKSFPVYSYLFLMKGGADAARPAHLTDGWED